MKRRFTALLTVVALISSLGVGGCITVTNNYYGTPDATTASTEQPASNNSAYYYNQGADWANYYSPWYSLFTYGAPYYGSPTWYGGSCFSGLYSGGRSYYGYPYGGYPYGGYRYTGYPYTGYRYAGYSNNNGCYPYQPPTPNYTGGVCPPPPTIDNGGTRDGIDAKQRRDTSHGKIRGVDDHGVYAGDGALPPTIRRDIRWGREGDIRPVGDGNDIHPTTRRDDPPQSDRAVDIGPQPDVHVVNNPFPGSSDNGGRSSGTLEVHDGGAMVRIDRPVTETGGAVRERPVTAAPVTSAPVHVAPAEIAPPRERPAAPVTAAPVHVAPAVIAPPREQSSAPVTAAPVHVAPAVIAPPRERSVTAAPAAPVHAAPAVVTPARENSVTAAPVTAAPVHATPVQAAPATATPSATVATPRSGGD